VKITIVFAVCVLLLAALVNLWVLTWSLALIVPTLRGRRATRSALTAVGVLGLLSATPMLVIELSDSELYSGVGLVEVGLKLVWMAAVLLGLLAIRTGLHRHA